jgi:hypothetical protein
MQTVRFEKYFNADLHVCQVIFVRDAKIFNMLPRWASSERLCPILEARRRVHVGELWKSSGLWVWILGSAFVGVFEFCRIEGLIVCHAGRGSTINR